MKQILSIISVTVALILFFFLISVREVNYYMKQSFYSNAAVIVNSFEYQILLGKYEPDDNMKYIMLNTSDIGVSINTFNPEASYIAFKLGKQKNGVNCYLTLVGKGRYTGFAYKNTKCDDIEDLSNIVSSRKTNIKELLKSIKAKKY